MESSTQFLFLASGVKNGKGFWFIGVENCDKNILKDYTVLECYRKELIGNESAKDILFAINLNIKNLLSEPAKNKYLLDQTSSGISFNFPLGVLENIFDFWVEIYKKKESWDTCFGLLKIRKRVSLSNLINSGSLKGNSKKWAIEIEKLHTYKEISVKNKNKYDPMWK